MSSLVADRVRAALPGLPRAERRVAHEILASYPVSGLETVARLAQRANVSGPTVIRLIARLGFDGFPDFQAALRSEIEDRNASPLLQYKRRQPADDGDHVLLRTATLLASTVEDSLAEADPEPFAKAVSLLCDSKRRLLTAGGRFSGLTARNLAQHLAILRPGCRHLEPNDWVPYLLEARRGDVLVLFDMRRYQRTTVLFGQEAVRRGATLIMVTDPWMSPLAVDAEVILTVSVEASSPFDSQVPALAMVEALIAGAVEFLGDRVTTRITDYDELWDAQSFAYLEPGRADR